MYSENCNKDIHNMILLGAPMFYLFIMIITYEVPSPQTLFVLYKNITPEITFHFGLLAFYGSLGFFL